ncbi:MAG: nitroreductase family protein [Candidatus Helarchaeota archaeon]
MEIIKTRRTIRKYKNKKVEEDKINKLIEAARWAPSSANLQPIEFIIINDDKIKEKITKITGHKRYKFAPIVIVVCINFERYRAITKYYDLKNQLGLIDASLAIQNLMLMAHAEGLGTAWGDIFDKNAIKTLLALPEKNIEPFILIPVGYPEGEVPMPPTRRQLKELIHWNSWSSKSSPIQKRP